MNSHRVGRSIIEQRGIPGDPNPPLIIIREEKRRRTFERNGRSEEKGEQGGEREGLYTRKNIQIAGLHAKYISYI